MKPGMKPQKQATVPKIEIDLLRIRQLLQERNDENWEFQNRYREDLKIKPQLIDQLREFEKRHGAVTLIYSARDERRNQAAVLYAFLQVSA